MHHGVRLNIMPLKELAHLNQYVVHQFTLEGVHSSKKGMHLLRMDMIQQLVSMYMTILLSESRDLVALANLPVHCYVLPKVVATPLPVVAEECLRRLGPRGIESTGLVPLVIFASP